MVLASCEQHQYAFEKPVLRTMTFNADCILEELHVHYFCVVAPLFHSERINGTEHKHLDILQLGSVKVDPVLSQFPDYADYLNGFQIQLLLRIFLDTLNISKTNLCLENLQILQTCFWSDGFLLNLKADIIVPKQQNKFFVVTFNKPSANNTNHVKNCRHMKSN